MQFKSERGMVTLLDLGREGYRVDFDCFEGDVIGSCTLRNLEEAERYYNKKVGEELL